MPDIAKCKNITCPLRESCYRYTCPPSEYMQSYGEFAPKEVKGIMICEYQIEIDE